MRFWLWFLCFYFVYLNFAEVIENPELPFTSSFFHLNVGDRIVIKARLEKNMGGIFVNLSNKRKTPYSFSGKNVILHLEICPNEGKSFATAAHDFAQFFPGAVEFDCAMKMAEVGTINIVMEENRFLIDVNGVQNYYTYKLPLIFGKFLVVGKSKRMEGEAFVESVKIVRNPQTPLVFLPRYRDTAGKQHLAKAIAENGRMDNCAQMAIDKLHRFYMFGNNQFDCQTMDKLSKPFPHFELFPHWFVACPCACFSNPDDVKILHLPSHFIVKDSRMNRPTTIIIEEVSSNFDLLIHFKGQFAVEFFERPTNISHNCDLFEQPLLRVSNLDDSSSVTHWKYTGKDTTLRVRKSNTGLHYQISTSPTGAEAPDGLSDVYKNIGFLRIKGINRLSYKYR